MCKLVNKTYNSYDQNTELKQIRVHNHGHPPFLYRSEGLTLQPRLKGTAYRDMVIPLLKDNYTVFEHVFATSHCK